MTVSDSELTNDNIICKILNYNSVVLVILYLEGKIREIRFHTYIVIIVCIIGRPQRKAYLKCLFKGIIVFISNNIKTHGFMCVLSQFC